VEQNYSEALKWYELSVEQDCEEAQYRLGLMYLEGKGVPANKEEALRLLRFAAKNGYEDAAEKLEELGEALES